MSAARISLLLIVFVSGPVFAQFPDEDNWELEDGYQNDLLFLHEFVNYSFDPAWQFDWERRRFADNALRINTGSVASDELLTDIDANINEPLNDKWRFFGQFTRDGFRSKPNREEQLLLGLERQIFESSAIYVGVNPEYEKEFIDAEIGYGWYGDDRQRYVRLGVRLEDLNYEGKNGVGGLQEQDAIKLAWATRIGIADNLYLYSEGLFGTGFERTFPNAETSPDVARHDQNDNRASFRLTHSGPEERLWSFILEYYDFAELKEFREPGFDYDYESRQFNAGVEHVRLLTERRRLRVVAQYVDWEASSTGFREHDFSRQDIVAGIFYEFLWPTSGITIAYAGGSPDYAYEAADPAESYTGGEYTDKLILSWRYNFSDDAVIRAGISHEAQEQGFGGAFVQYQMFF